jgi:hypothetical protein
MLSCFGPVFIPAPSELPASHSSPSLPPPPACRCTLTTAPSAGSLHLHHHSMLLCNHGPIVANKHSRVRPNCPCGSDFGQFGNSPQKLLQKWAFCTWISANFVGQASAGRPKSSQFSAMAALLATTCMGSPAGQWCFEILLPLPSFFWFLV